jgi:hypothetical protein
MMLAQQEVYIREQALVSALRAGGAPETAALSGSYPRLPCT